jgi:hypothetical protein
LYLFDCFFFFNGSVFSFGYNRNGDLGIGSETDQNYPQKIKFENDEKIDKIFSNCNCNGCFFYSSWCFFYFLKFYYLFKFFRK